MTYYESLILQLLIVGISYDGLFDEGQTSELGKEVWPYCLMSYTPRVTFLSLALFFLTS